MEKIIFFGLVIPIFAFVLYLGGNAIMKGMSAKNANKENKEPENNEIETISLDSVNSNTKRRRRSKQPKMVNNFMDL